MNLLKYFFLLCTVFCFSLLAKAENLSIEEDIRLVEQYSLTSDFNKIDSILDKLLIQIEENKTDKIEYGLEINYLKALYFEQRNLLKEAIDQIIPILKLKTLRQNKAIIYKINLLLALIFEKEDNAKTNFRYLEKARANLNDFDLDSIAANYYIRVSSYYRFESEVDSALKYANLALVNAEKYNNKIAVDAHLLLGMLYEGEEVQLGISHIRESIKIFSKKKDYYAVCAMYGNIATLYNNMGEYSASLLYSDTALQVCYNNNTDIPSFAYLAIYKSYKRMNLSDSALFYLETYTDLKFEELKKSNQVEINEINEKFQNENNLQIIKEKEIENKRAKSLQMWLLSIIILFSILFLLLVVLFQKVKKQKVIANIKSIELEKVVGQRENLLAELHHRVKNNLQIISNILEFQTEYSDDDLIKKITLDSQNRINSMKLIHSNLYLTKDFGNIDFKNYIDDLVDSIDKSFFTENKNIICNVSVESLIIELDIAIPLGMIITEILSNIYKHAFTNLNSGEINVILSTENNIDYKLEIKDNGKGFPKDFDFSQCKSLGLEIVFGLLKQIGATHTIETENGTNFCIYLKID